MKNRFVKITLILTMLLIMAVPTQAFAAEKTCNLNPTTLLNTNISTLYSHHSSTSINQLMNQLSQYNGGKIDATQLQSLMNKYLGGKVTTAPSAPAKTTTPAAPTTPAKTTTPAAPAAPAAPSTPAKTTTPSGSAALNDYEQQVVTLVNKERAAAGLSALTVNSTLANVAETKAADLRDENYFDHQSPKYGSPFDMMHSFGITYSYAGENIAKGQRTPDEVMNGWMNSPGHRANILNANYTQIGVGYVTDSNGTGYWVQEFIRP